MNSSLIEKSPSGDVATRPGTADASRAGSSPWTWMIAACLILGLSGGVRFYRDHQFAKLSSEFKESPFPLEEFGKTLGTWRMVENSDTKLDAEIARIAGSSAHILRTYVDSQTGEKIHVMVLYGLAQDVFSHTPDICFPASGYQAATPPKDHVISRPSAAEASEPATYRSQVFYRGVGPSGGQYTESAYTFRLGGSHDAVWTPDMASLWKSFRYRPGMFKIQMTRDVSAAAASPDAPKSTISESLITEMVREVERRLASAQPSV
jgi:hypothetical protein